MYHSLFDDLSFHDHDGTLSIVIPPNQTISGHSITYYFTLATDHPVPLPKPPIPPTPPRAQVIGKAELIELLQESINRHVLANIQAFADGETIDTHRSDAAAIALIDFQKVIVNYV